MGIETDDLTTPVGRLKALVDFLLVGKLLALAQKKEEALSLAFLLKKPDGSGRLIAQSHEYDELIEDLQFLLKEKTETKKA